MTARLAVATFVVLLARTAVAQPPGINQDEAKVPPYTLPDPLILSSGERVTDAVTWESKRRPEILRLFETHVYGKMPGRPERLSFAIEKPEVEDALGGKATRKELEILFTGDDNGPRMDLLLYVPNRVPGPHPVVLALNFGGNHAVDPDPRISLARPWTHTDPKKNFNPDETTRGKEASRWPLEHIIDRGYAVATAYYGDIDPDFDDGFKNGVHPLFDPPGETRAADAWGSIGAWAWGLSRAMDYLETDGDIDAKRVTLMGHSRLGKTALWAGHARDRRFAGGRLQRPGRGRGALSPLGGTARRSLGSTRASPTGSTPNYKQYKASGVADLPVDQHMLLALIAPRPVLILSADEDQWADPRGEFLGAKGADPVYRLLGTDGLAVRDMPGNSVLAWSRIGYQIRPGKHDVTLADWDAVIGLLDRHLGQAKIPAMIRRAVVLILLARCDSSPRPSTRRSWRPRHPSGGERSRRRRLLTARRVRWRTSSPGGIAEDVRTASPPECRWWELSSSTPMCHRPENPCDPPRAQDRPRIRAMRRALSRGDILLPAVAATGVLRRPGLGSRQRREAARLGRSTSRPRPDRAAPRVEALSRCSRRSNVPTGG